MSSVIWATLADRVWWAYYCLDRDASGNLPTKKSLEDDVGLFNGVLGKLMDESKKDPRGDTLTKVAKALKCDLEWLMTGRGEGPRPSWPVPERPQKTKRSTDATLGIGPRTLQEVDGQLSANAAALTQRKRKERN